MILLRTVNFVLLLILFSCQTTKHAHSPQMITEDGRKMLYGEITLNDLFQFNAGWKKEAVGYKIDPKILLKLKGITGRYTINIVLATWCSDSEREVPRFFKIIEESGLKKQLKIRMWATNRQLQVEGNLSKKLGIERVATFIFYKDNQEIGRIIESPEAFLLEEDILNILQAGEEQTSSGVK